MFAALFQHDSNDERYYSNFLSAFGSKQQNNLTSVGTFCSNSINRLSQLNDVRSWCWSRNMELCFSEHIHFISYRMDLATSVSTCDFVPCIWTILAAADLKFFLDSDAIAFSRLGVILQFLVDF